MSGFSLRRAAVPAFGPALLFGFAEGAILPVIPLGARELDASVPLAALAVGLVGVGATLGNLPATLVITRRGERWTLVAAAAWCALAMALCAWTRQLEVFALGCFMIGMAQAVFTLARQSYLTAVVPVGFRARAMSVMGGVGRFGLFLGPLASAAAIHRFGLAAAYVIGIAVLAGTAIVSARVPELPAAEPARTPAGCDADPCPPTLAATLREHRRVFLTVGFGSLLVCAVRAARPALIPLWADHLGLEAAVASLIYGLAAGIELLVFYPAGKVMDRKGRRWVVVPSMLLTGGGMLLMPATTGAASLLAAALVIGLGNGIGSGMVMTLGADHSPPRGRAHFLGLWHLVADLGAAAGPALLSLLAATFSLAAGIVAIGVLGLASAGQLAYWIPRVAPAASAPPAGAERGHGSRP